MANPADAKAALLSDELREYALTLPTSVFPKAGNGNFFCAICSELAFDSWKLLCCNKSICSSCHDKLEFPTTCPLCEHSPLEADLCTVNKTLRNTMRAWLQKNKKKEDAKNASQAPTSTVTATPVSVEPQQSMEVADKPVESVESVTREEGATDEQATAAAEGKDDVPVPEGSVTAPSAEPSNAPHGDEAQQAESAGDQEPGKSTEPTSAAQDQNTAQSTTDGANDSNGMFGNNNMMQNMGGMPGQLGFGFNGNQGNFNNGMGWNGMNPMGAMPNMMMNPMDFNMYGGFGGMGMPGMNDMSAMNMMGYGGGFGNGWQGGMNGGNFGNFNGYNNMGGYNQPGAQYPQMMNQFPKNNFQNPQNNHSHANGASSFAQQKNNRRGSSGIVGNQNQTSGPGFQQGSAHSRPGSQAGPQNINRDGVSSAGNAEAASEAKVKDEHAEASAEPQQDGKAQNEGLSESVKSPTHQADNAPNDPNALTRAADDQAISSDAAPHTGLNQIQTVDSIETGPIETFDQSMMNGGMHANQGFGPGMMMHDFPGQDNDMNMNGSYGPGMGYNQHQHQNRNFGFGGSNTAYGAATVLIGEPKGLGVEGAPTGPRAMREGRPNTGFSSRASQVRQHQPSQTPAPAATSPARGGRASPKRDDALRTQNRSPTRSRSNSKSRAREEDRHSQRGRSRTRSPDRESRRNHRERSKTPEDDYDREKERYRHRSSRYDERDDRADGREREDDVDYGDDEYDDRYRDDKGSRGDRTRSTSQESKHHGRRDKEKDKYRSSRSHRDRSRDRSREHRSRRHRSRSHSPHDEKHPHEDTHANGSEYRESRSERKERKEREKDRDRRERREHDRDDRDYEKDYEYEKEKERSRDKDKDRRRSRRDREDEERDYEYDDEKHRSSRRSRKDRDRERDRDRDRDAGRDRERDRDREYEKSNKNEQSATRIASPPLNAPTGPSADGFSIRGFSKAKRASLSTSVTATPTEPKAMPPPPTGPRALQPPKGPAADRDRDRDRRGSKDHRRKSSMSLSSPVTPATPTTPTDHYAAEREKNIKERVEREYGRSSTHSKSNSNTNSLSSRITPALSSKRSRDDVDSNDKDKDTPSIPTGPAAHRDKRRKSGPDNAIANMFTAGLRKRSGKESRRGGVKREGESERELERTERERDRRW